MLCRCLIIQDLPRFFKPRERDFVTIWERNAFPNGNLAASALSGASRRPSHVSCDVHETVRNAAQQAL